MLYNVQGVEHLTALDVSHNYLRGLDSDIFTASPKLIHLNLSFNKLSKLNVTMMPQLVKAISTVDLSGNPWVCDCVMFSTVYAWCRNTSVDLGLVCSSPPKFKDKPWTVYENAGCDDDDDDNDDDDEGDDIHFADPVETIKTVAYKSSHTPVEKYRGQVMPDPLPSRIQEPNVPSDINYFYICIGLFVALLCLLTGAGFLWYRLKSRTFRRTGPACSDAETCRLSGVTA
jgi:hypothetical protein